VTKRIVLLILTIFCIVSAFVACQNIENGNNLQSGGNDVSETIVDLADIYADDLPDYNFNGAPFRMNVLDQTWLTLAYYAEEDTGDLINDAAFARNRNIEERFNVKFSQTLIPLSADNERRIVALNVMAGIDEYELYIAIDRYALMYGPEGVIYKISELPNINLDKPYWSQSMNECLSIGGELVFAYGAFSLSVYDYTQILTFDKQMILDLKLDAPYEMVSTGNWTFDKYDEMAKAAVRDLNGDGIMDENDNYGIVSDPKNILPGFWIGAGVQSIAKTKDDIPQFNLLGDEKFADVIQKIFTISYDNNSWFRCDATKYMEHYKRLIDGQSLFYISSYSGIISLRAIETEFGIIPYPKWDAKQDKYYSRVSGGSPFVVPVTVTDLEMVGAVIEALNAESAKLVIPAYYDVSLKTKYSRDNESAAMLDLIFANRIYDLGDTYWCNTLRDGIFVTMFSKNDRNLASVLAGVESKIIAEIDEIVNALIK